MPSRAQLVARYAADARREQNVREAASVLRGAAIGLPSHYFTTTERELLGTLLQQIEDACETERVTLYNAACAEQG